MSVELEALQTLCVSTSSRHSNQGNELNISLCIKNVLMNNISKEIFAMLLIINPHLMIQISVYKYNLLAM